MTEEYAIPVVSIIVEAGDGSRSILLQERSKPEAGRFRGFLELPQGRLRKSETLVECAARELEEETGLTNFRPRTDVQTYSCHAERLEGSATVIVRELGFHSFVAACMIGSASGKPRSSEESRAPRWFSVEEVKQLLKEQRVFPLNVPMLEEYVSKYSVVG